MVKTIAKMFQEFKNWLNRHRHSLFSWYTKDSQEIQEPEQSLVELPTAIRNKLVECIENLPINPAEEQAIASAIEEAFTLWRENPNNTNNSITILSSPVTAVSRILSETLEKWSKDQQVPMTLLSLTARPNVIETIKSKLESELERQFSENNSEAELEIVVIPNLSWCFLRCIEGLSGIEYLQSLLCDDSQHRFWIIGANQIGWQYLNSVCHLEACCGSVFTVPAIAPEELAHWLEPIIDELNINFAQPRMDKQILDGDKDDRTNYFEVLADISQGVSIVAVQEFLRSIRYQEHDEEQTKPPQPILLAQTPQLAKLPDFSSADLYLLYSLLLHGDLTLSALAESLGDDQAEVRARVQNLRRQGIVQQQNQVLKINPIHYARLKQELDSNNFIIN